MEQKEQGFDTICIHGGHRGEQHRAHLTPIYASSTYTFDSAEQGIAIFRGEEEGYIYGRFGNPTIREAEEKIASLEGYGLGIELGALLHSSGMAAITTMLLANLSSGDKIITHRSLYGGTQELIDKVLPPLGIEAIIVDFHDLQKVEECLAANKGIRAMYLETPANPTLRCIDGSALCALAKARGLLVLADNTFATPYLQQPFSWGVDYVMHSTTKFLNGHGTAVGGVIVFRSDAAKEQNAKLLKTHRLLGGNSNAFEAFLLTNGVRTLGIRMERHCSNAQQIASFLESNQACCPREFSGLKITSRLRFGHAANEDGAACSEL